MLYLPSGPGLKPAGHVRAIWVNGAQFSRDESRILIWSRDYTARVWLLDADIDFPAEDVELWIQAVTGTDYDFVTHQLRPIDPERRRLIREQYEKVAADHAKVCKYLTVPSENAIWREYL